MVDVHDVHDKSGWVTGTVLARQAQDRPDAVFLREADGGALTYEQADRLSNQVAHGFAALGVERGDRVAVMLPNRLEYCVSWFGLNRIGAVHVAVNTAYKGEFLRHLITDAGARIAVVHAGFLPHFADIESDLPALECIVVVGDPEQAGGASFDRIGVRSWDEIPSPDDSPPDVEISYRDLATIMYTSGTTGPSKGVLMPHAHIYLLGLGAVENLSITSGDVYYCCLPLFHANGMFLQAYACLIAGARVVMVPKFSAARWLDDVHDHGCTMVNHIGVMNEFLLDMPESDRDGTSKLRLVQSVPTPPALRPAFRERFGAPMVEVFGMTECNVPLYEPVDAPRDGTCGRVWDRYFEVRVVDPDTDEELPAGTVGEIVVRPRTPFGFMQGYNGRPAQTVEAWRNFWFHTGDGGYVDGDGYFFFVDRIKDSIRRRGENIPSFQVERVLMQFPGVKDAAAISVRADELGGEDEIKACLVLDDGLRPDGIDLDKLLAWCEEHIPGFAVPRYYEVLAALPKTPTEKVQKAKLREAGLTASTWDRRS